MFYIWSLIYFPSDIEKHLQTRTFSITYTVIIIYCSEGFFIGRCVSFGYLFSAASYRGRAKGEDNDHYAARIAFTGNSRILGPACIVVGVLMLVAGFVLCILTRRARRREQTIGFHCPLHGDFYPLSPITSSRTIGKHPDFQLRTKKLV